jgi:hypothetical protein
MLQFLWPESASWRLARVPEGMMMSHEKGTPTELGIIRFPGRIASSEIVESCARDGRVREAQSRQTAVTLGTATWSSS